MRILLIIGRDQSVIELQYLIYCSDLKAKMQTSSKLNLSTWLFIIYIQNYLVLFPNFGILEIIQIIWRKLLFLIFSYKLRDTLIELR